MPLVRHLGQMPDAAKMRGRVRRQPAQPVSFAERSEEHLLVPPSDGSGHVPHKRCQLFRRHLLERSRPQLAHDDGGLIRQTVCQWLHAANGERVGFQQQTASLRSVDRRVQREGDLPADTLAAGRPDVGLVKRSPRTGPSSSTIARSSWTSCVDDAVRAGEEIPANSL